MRIGSSALRVAGRVAFAASTFAWLAIAAIAAAPISPGANALHAQGVVVDDSLAAALSHEDAGRLLPAARAYRVVLDRALAVSDGGDRVALALLGLERVLTEAGQRDSLAPDLARVLQARPADPVARSIQFRSVSTAPGDTALARAFEEWRRAAPREAAPYREYARLLVSAGRMLAADSVLRLAERSLGTRRDVASEVAQLQLALERWGPAADAWREAVEAAPYLETPALFALGRVPARARDTVRLALQAGTTLPVRRLRAGLELAWGDPRAAWRALADARGDDSVFVAWREFAERAELAGEWSVARDVWSALFRETKEREAALRAADASLRTGAAETALVLLTAVRETRGVAPESAPQRAARLALEVRALGMLGRAEDAAERARAAETLPPAAREAVQRELVTAWLRVGDLARAREAATRAEALNDDAIAGWLALYDGDLDAARRRLVRLIDAEGPLVEALAVLARTRRSQHVGLGQAFLSLSRGDTAATVRAFRALADSLDDAAPALLASAARLAKARGDTATAHATWSRLLDGWATAPEIPEVLLELARAASRRGERAEAQSFYERLIVDFPDSALVPQARLERERLAGRVPGGPL